MTTTMRSPSWMTRAKKGIIAFFNRVKELFKTKRAKSARPDEQVQPDDNLDDDQSYKEYLQKIAGLKDVISELGLHERISAGHKYMYEIGRRDGSLGVTLTNLIDIARATAREMFRHLYVVLKGKLAALTAEFDAAKSIKDYDEELYKREQAYYDYAKYQYRFFPRSYSFFLFALYFVFAVALIIADMPLALILIQNGFDLPMGQDEESFRYLFKGNFWGITAANWETAITAAGVALCTIYIKIYYDEFVGTPYANRVMTLNRFLEENKFQHSGNVDIDAIKNEHRAKRRWKTGLIIFTIAAIVALAFFRLQTAAASNEYMKFNFVSKSAFLAITLLFPVIGGICLSYSLNNIQNLTRLWGAKGKCNASRKKWMSAVEAFTKVEKKYKDLEAADSRLNDEDRIVEEYKDYLWAFYQRGYAIGMMQPEKYTRGEDFFTKILEWRNITISRKINTHIGSLR